MDDNNRDNVLDEDDISSATDEEDSISDEDATGGDVSGEEESETDQKSQKRDRKMERIKKLSAAKRKAEERMADLEEQNRHLTKIAAGNSRSNDGEEDVSNEDLEEMGFSDKQVQQLKKVVNKAGGISELQSEIETLKSELKKDRESKVLADDNREKKDVLKKYKGVVEDQEELDEMIETLQSDSDPRVRVLASARWETIVRHFKGDEIAEMAADESIKSKKKGGPRISGGISGDRKPNVKSDPLPTGNLNAASEELLNSIMSSMSE